LRNTFGNFLGLVPIGNLTDKSVNLLFNPGFDTPESVVGQNIWHWEPAGRTQPYGSVYANGDGSPKELLSNEIWVAAEQVVQAEVWLNWMNVGFWPGTVPFEIGLSRYFEGQELQPSILLASPPNPTAHSLNWVTKLAGEYTVPDNIDAVKLVLRINPAATAGKISFDDASVTKTAQTMPQKWVSGLPGILGTITGSIADLLNGLFRAFQGIAGNIPIVGTTIAGLIGAAENLWADIQSRLTGSSPLFAGNIVGAIADSIVPGIGTIVNNVTNMLFGWIPGVGEQRTHQQSAEALEAVREIQLANQTALQAFLATLTAGILASDNFMRTNANTLGPNWYESYSAGPGYFTIKNNMAVWEPGLGTREGLFLWLGPGNASQTDYQDVGVVLASGPGRANLVLGFVTGYNDVICRAALGNYVRWRCGGDRSWELSYYTAATKHVVQTGELPYTPSAGTFIHIQAGVYDDDNPANDNPRLFRCWLGSDLITQWEDTTAATAMGAANRGWGMGGQGEGGTIILVTASVGPGSLQTWLARDQR
jgi:hypothetical protein